MTTGINKFTKKSFLVGATTLLPIGIILGIFSWFYNFIAGIIHPATAYLVGKSDMSETLANLIVVAIIIVLCCVVGAFIRTRAGKFFHEVIEERLLNMIPGYNIAKETVLQFIGNKKSPFETVAVARIFENSTLVFVFITDTYGNYCTVFMPTGPNPTSGNIYTLPQRMVHEVDVPVEVAMKAIISCGAGAAKIMAALEKSHPELIAEERALAEMKKEIGEQTKEV